MLDDTIEAMLSAGAWLAVLGSSSRATWADVLSHPSPAAVQVEVDAPAECMTKEDLIRRVQTRAPGLRFADDSAAWIARATFSNAGAGRVAAEVAIAGPDATNTARHLVARSCDEAADGVAFIIAVTLEQVPPTDAAAAAKDAHSTPAGGTSASGSAPPAPSPPPPSPSPPATSNTQPPEVATAPPDSRPTAARPALDAARLRETVPVESRHQSTGRWRFGADVAAQMLIGPAPRPMWGPTLYGVASFERHTLWSPAVFVGVTHAWATGLSETGGTASFLLDAATVQACPLGAHAGAFDAHGCAAGLVGRLTATGSATTSPATAERPFAAAGLAAIVSAHLGVALAISARVDAGVTIVRDSFEFAPATFYRAPPITVLGSLGLGVRVP